MKENKNLCHKKWIHYSRDYQKLHLPLWQVFLPLMHPWIWILSPHLRIPIWLKCWCMVKSFTLLSDIFSSSYFYQLHEYNTGRKEKKKRLNFPTETIHHFHVAFPPVVRVLTNLDHIHSYWNQSPSNIVFHIWLKTTIMQKPVQRVTWFWGDDGNCRWSNFQKELFEFRNLL